jgi:hypothetical protein
LFCLILNARVTFVFEYIIRDTTWLNIRDTSWLNILPILGLPLHQVAIALFLSFAWLITWAYSSIHLVGFLLAPFIEFIMLGWCVMHSHISFLLHLTETRLERGMGVELGHLVLKINHKMVGNNLFEFDSLIR